MLDWEYHRWYEDHPHLRYGKDSGPLDVCGQERGKTPETKYKDEEAFFTPSGFQIWSSHQEQTQETESKPSDQSTSAEIQATFISTQPTTGNASRLWGLARRNSIQAKEHHTDEELRSLTLEALSVAYPFPIGARTYTDGSAEEATKMAEVESSLSSPTADPSGSLWLQSSSQQTTELKPVQCS